MKPQLPTKLFAVTDHHEIIPLKVVDFKELTSTTVLTTEIDMDNPSESFEYFHETHFRKLYTSENDPTGRPSVFLNMESAKEFACKHIDEAIRVQESKLESLKRKRANYSLS